MVSRPAVAPAPGPAPAPAAGPAAGPAAVAPAPAVAPRLVVAPPPEDPDFPVDSPSPNDLALRYERSLLSVLLWQDPVGALARAVQPLVAVEDFLLPAHGSVFRGALWLLKRHGLVDYALLRERAARQGATAVLAALSEITAGVEGLPCRAEHYAREVRRRAVLRGLAELDAVRAVARLEHGDDPAALAAALEAARAAEVGLLGRLGEGG